jgi:nucleoside-diphosphate-sugar epimerase
MSLELQQIAIVGASGPTGVELARELTGRGVRVRAIARDGARLRARLGPLEVEVREADARRADAIGPATEGAELIVDAVGMPVSAGSEHVAVAHSLAGLASRTGARLLHVSSFWSYFPIQRLPLDESHPRQDGPDIARQRRDAEDILQRAGAAVVHLPDFYGPGVGASTVQRALDEAVAKGTFGWIGATDVERDAIFVPDAMRVVADLAAHEEAYGERWIVPGGGPLTANELADLLSIALGRRIRARRGPMWLLRLAGLFSAELRAFLPLAPHYAAPIRYDGRKLHRLLGETTRTPHETAIRRTLEALG